MGLIAKEKQDLATGFGGYTPNDPNMATQQPLPGMPMQPPASPLPRQRKKKTMPLRGAYQASQGKTILP